MSEDKSGSPPCGIYLRIDDFSNMLDLIGYVRQMAFAINRSSGYEKNMAAVEVVFEAGDEERNERVFDLIPIIKDQGLVALISGLPDGVEDLHGADGVIVDIDTDIAALRTIYGEDAIIGVTTGSKQEALQALSMPVDCIIMQAAPGLLAELNMRAEGLVIARGKGITNKNCGALAQAGANLIDVSDYLLGHKKGVMQATVNVLHELDAAMNRPDTVN